MLIDALILAVIIGYLRGGRLRHLARLELRAETLILIALVIQWTTPMLARAFGLPPNFAFAVWLIAFMLLMVALLMNRDRPALLVAAAGVGSNLLVIALNGGMPVLPAAIRFLDPSKPLTSAAFAGDPLYHLAGPATRLPFLADAIPWPWPPFQRGVMSIGDVLLMAGVFWLVQEGMNYRGKRRISR